MNQRSEDLVLDPQLLEVLPPTPPLGGNSSKRSIPSVSTFFKRGFVKHREVYAAWYRDNPGANSFYATRRKWVEKLKIFQILGSQCENCGETDIRVLQIHHKNGDGRHDRMQFGTGTQPLYRAIKNGKRTTNDLGLLCANCNLKYEYETGRVGRHRRTYFKEGIIG